MAHDPSTFRGALLLLGEHDLPWLLELDRLLDGVPLDPDVRPRTDGWLVPKAEAKRLLRLKIDQVPEILEHSSGLQRHTLLIAAHTLMVVMAFFEAWGTSDAAYQERHWTTGMLYSAAVPTPSAVRSFTGNLGDLLTWTATHFLRFGDIAHNGPLAGRAVDRYRERFLALAPEVPEFAMWASTGRDTAPRAAMGRLEDLLHVVAEHTHPRDLCAVLRDLNRAVLSRPVVDVHADGYGDNARFPSIESIFVTPRCKVHDRLDRLSDDHLWNTLTEVHDLEPVLARHFCSAEATRLPLLLLGHPGAGKSLVTKVIAARLPLEGYSVVRVPLRSVDADATITAQIQQALDLTTHGRVPWADLADQAEHLMRVVLLDGLDELLQATNHDRAGYLHEVAEFQRVEAAVGRPLSIVVTSRTLVMDRVGVPEDTPVVRLEPFHEAQIRAWIEVWNQVNATTRPFSPDTALAHRDLACQPLLLLMLALYYADPQVDQSEQLSVSDLYERLFDTYARREVTKKAGRPLHGQELTDAVEDQLLRLSVAALGMFNRGRQDITEAELGADLKALVAAPTPGERLLAEFFFVHAPEASGRKTLRSYEFLHATFAEYLVANRIVEVLRDVAEGAFGRRREHEPDDDLLHALISHQPLSVQAPVRDFVRTRLNTLEDTERDRVFRTLEALLHGYRRRKPSKSYTDYRPLDPDALRALAAYSANLVVLRLWAPGWVPLTVVSPDRDQWQAAVNLWQAGLDADGRHSVLNSLHLVDDELFVHNTMPDFLELKRARLLGDDFLERRLRTGFAIHDQLSYLVADGSPEQRAREWVEFLSGWLHASEALPPAAAPDLILCAPPDAVPQDVRELLAGRAYALLARRSREWPTGFTAAFENWLYELTTLGEAELPEPDYTSSQITHTTADFAVGQLSQSREQDR
ncbi:hypothetical protein [Actinosynnema sp. NPDC020468]|uniref:NACHT domain-containing protein n=1 Tax=Actinosynnema sp. NPDC020468 TaxID=3154488 RepID=UPI003407E8EE